MSKYVEVANILPYIALACRCMPLHAVACRCMPLHAVAWCALYGCFGKVESVDSWCMSMLKLGVACCGRGLCGNGGYWSPFGNQGIPEVTELYYHVSCCCGLLESVISVISWTYLARFGNDNDDLCTPSNTSEEKLQLIATSLIWVCQTIGLLADLSHLDSATGLILVVSWFQHHERGIMCARKFPVGAIEWRPSQIFLDILL